MYTPLVLRDLLCLILPGDDDPSYVVLELDQQMDAGRMKDDPKMNAIERGQGGRGRFLVWHARLAVSGNI